MQINWFTVIAQILNFFLLVWLLKRYLYKPILLAIGEREKRIAAQLQDAADIKAEAIKEQEDFRDKNERFDQKKKAMMDKAVVETAAAREKLLESARSEAIALQSKLEKAARTEQENHNLEIAKKTRQEVLAISRKTLGDLASVGLEEQVTYIFVKRLNELNAEEKKQFIEAFKPNDKPILVRSAFELADEQQGEIKSAVHKILGMKTAFQFEIKPEIISGIELVTNGFILAWSISEYLDSLEKNVSKPIKETAVPE